MVQVPKITSPSTSVNQEVGRGGLTFKERNSQTNLRNNRALAREKRKFGRVPPGYVPKPKNTLQFANSTVKLVPPDSEEAKAIPAQPKRKVTKVAVDEVIPLAEGEDEYAVGMNLVTPLQGPGLEFAPNKGTQFDGMKFLADVSPGTARQITLTEDDLQAILYMAMDGASRNDCADIVGVCDTTLIRLEQRNPLWKAAWTRARAMGKLNLIKRVRNGDSHWQSSAWMLERLYRKEYGANVQDEQETKIIRVRPVFPNQNQGPQLNKAPNGSVPLPGDPHKGTNGNGNGNGHRLLENTPTTPAPAPAPEEQPAQTNIENGVDQLIDIDQSTVVPGTKKVRSRSVKRSA